eukprot:scaffold1129_cov164-Ochromonas_danica.AAC.5
MMPVDIEIAGRNTFHCPIGWTAGQAEARIRSSRLLMGGEIEKDGAAMDTEDPITADGHYHFVNFQEQLGGGGGGGGSGTGGGDSKDSSSSISMSKLKKKCLVESEDDRGIPDSFAAIALTSPDLKMKFNVNGSINRRDTRRYFMVDVQESNAQLYEWIEEGKFVTLCGPRASGKSTRMEHSSAYLQERNLLVLKITLQGICSKFTSESEFWGSIGFLLSPYFEDSVTLRSGADFINLFLVKHNEQKERVVLYIDEFDVLQQNEVVLTSLLNALRGIKSRINLYHLHSVVIIGVTGVHHLNTKDRCSSPFNTSEVMVVPNLTLSGIGAMFADYQRCRHGRVVSEEVVKDVYELTNGHAGLVSMCGRAIDDYCFVTAENNRLELEEWSANFRGHIRDWLSHFPTMDRLHKDYPLQQYILQHVIGSEIIFRPTSELLAHHYDALLALGVTSERVLSNGVVCSGRSEISSPLLKKILLLHLDYNAVTRKIPVNILY